MLGFGFLGNFKVQLLRRFRDKKPNPSIRVAEAAKVIENSQRDINIAFMNELAIIFDKMGLDTAEVLEAAGKHHLEFP